MPEAALPPAVAAAIAGELESLTRRSARLPRRCGRGRRALRARPRRRRSPSCLSRRGSRRSTTCSPATWSAPPRSRGGSGSAIRWYAAASTSRPAGAGGSPRMPERSRRSPPVEPTRPSGASRRAVGDQGRPGRDRDPAGRGTGTARAPGAAARWFEAALRLLPSADAERQVDVRVALASSRRSLGELELCRTTLLEAAERLPAEAAMRRVELTGLLRRGGALAGPPRGRPPPAVAGLGGVIRPRARPRPRRSRSSWRSTGSTRTISSRRSRWARLRCGRRAGWATTG